MSSALLNDCIKDAELNQKAGVAVVTSDGSWMARKDIFIKNHFRQVDQAAPHFQLLVKDTGPGKTPFFPQNWNERLKRYQDLQLIYTNQCPYIGKAISELPVVAEKNGFHLNLVELTDSKEARKCMVSPYGMFNLIYNGRLLADHAISATRFENILKKELRIEVKR